MAYVPGKGQVTSAVGGVYDDQTNLLAFLWNQDVSSSFNYLLLCFIDIIGLVLFIYVKLVNCIYAYGISTSLNSLVCVGQNDLCYIETATPL